MIPSFVNGAKSKREVQSKLFEALKSVSFAYTGAVLQPTDFQEEKPVFQMRLIKQQLDLKRL